MPAGKPRLRRPIRDQVEMRWASLDDLLEADHPVRVVWAAVCTLDLKSWLGEIKAVEGHVGRDATDPRLLVALWVFATLKAIGSARELARLCEECLPYQWLCGGVSINYHMLSDFRSSGGEKWDELLTQIVATLLDAGLVKMDRVAQDGMRVRANAGKSSFHRRGTLEECLKAAKEQVETLKQLAEEDTAELTRRQRAARERAARERQQRIEEAMRQCEELQQQREASSGRKEREARASTTDPEARVMKFPDGGFRPGYNVQFATDTESGVIVGVGVTNAGNDGEELPPMLDQLHERYEQMPNEALVDGGFATKDSHRSGRPAWLHRVRADQCRGEETGGWKRSPRPHEGRQRCGCRVAEPNGDRGREVDLPAARPNGGVGQRPGPQPRILVHARARPTALSQHRIVVCNYS